VRYRCRWLQWLFRRRRSCRRYVQA